MPAVATVFAAAVVRDTAAESRAIPDGCDIGHRCAVCFLRRAGRTMDVSCAHRCVSIDTGCRRYSSIDAAQFRGACRCAWGGGAGASSQPPVSALDAASNRDPIDRGSVPCAFVARLHCVRGRLLFLMVRLLPVPVHRHFASDRSGRASAVVPALTVWGSPAARPSPVSSCRRSDWDLRVGSAQRRA